MRAAKSAIYHAKKTAQEEKFSDLNSNDKKKQIFKLARKMKDENQDIVGEKCIKQDNGSIVFSDTDKLAAWKSHYEKLMNVEFPWNPETLDEVPPVLGPPPLIDQKGNTSHEGRKGCRTLGYSSRDDTGRW